LEYDGFLVDVVDKDRKLTEQVCLGYRTHDVDCRDEEQLLIVSGPEVITEEEEAARVERHHILVGS
jgi:hypothetical protein